MGRRVAFIEVHVCGFYGQSATIGHGIPGIDHQVHDDLLNLSGVCLHPPQTRSRPGDQLNIFADEPAQHLIEVCHQAVEVDDPRLEQLHAAEGQQLPGESGGLVCRL